MGGWGEFILAGLMFLGSHAIASMPRAKGALVGMLGQRGWVLAFSMISTLLLFWVILSAGRAPCVMLWPQQIWQRWLVNIAMPVAIMLASFGIGAPNPFAFEGGHGFDPERPGIVGLTRQPLLWALLIWAGAHLVANGDLAHVVLFGILAFFSAIGMRAVEARNGRQFGQTKRARLSARTSLLPGLALITGRWHPRGLPSIWRLIAAFAAWAVLLHLHGPIIGVSPLP